MTDLDLASIIPEALRTKCGHEQIDGECVVRSPLRGDNSWKRLICDGTDWPATLARLVACYQDDLDYAKTTLHEPVTWIAEAELAALRARLSRIEEAAREALLPWEEGGFRDREWRELTQCNKLPDCPCQQHIDTYAALAAALEEG